jgi:hypothetical protein
MQHAPQLNVSSATPHVYRFGVATRACTSLAAFVYGGSGIFVAAKAFGENPAIGIVAGVVVALTAALILFLFLYPRLEIGITGIIARGPFAKRTLFASNIEGVVMTYSRSGRVVTLVPKDSRCKRLRIHPYFVTDQFFRDWLAGFPKLH